MSALLQPLDIREWVQVLEPAEVAQRGNIGMLLQMLLIQRLAAVLQSHCPVRQILWRMPIDAMEVRQLAIQHRLGLPPVRGQGMALPPVQALTSFRT
mmetsp:Transcript_130562/g.229950  ORF Transcript_130562/g.229950 Transcript_130562/m.229950 type:complete len:97 (-) Transcript_130562:585-875(-)